VERVFKEVAAAFPNRNADMYVDALCMQMRRDPRGFDSSSQIICSAIITPISPPDCRAASDGRERQPASGGDFMFEPGRSAPRLLEKILPPFGAILGGYDAGAFGHD